jgi:aminoglycoside 3-N-acetyltransferase
MNKHHYTTSDIRQSLAALPFGSGDVVFCHSNIGYFGRLAGNPGRSELCEIFFDALMDRLGPSGTLIVPTYTYSFPRGDTFDPGTTSSGMGLFAEWVREHPDSRRSADPSYSIAAIGANAVFHTADAPENSFGPGSHFHRLRDAEAKLLKLNHPGCTYIHYVEREFGVPYRFDKSFVGTLLENGDRRASRSTIWVRYLSDDTLVHRPYGFEAVAREQEKMVSHRLGRGEITMISCRDAYDLIADTLPKRPWFLTAAESMGVDHPQIVPE